MLTIAELKKKKMKYQHKMNYDYASAMRYTICKLHVLITLNVSRVNRDYVL